MGVNGWYSMGVNGWYIYGCNLTITIDDYGNGYFSAGGSLSAPDILSGSARGAGGWILSEQELKKGSLGVDWESRLGSENSPTEAELKNYLTGWSGSLGGGFIVGVDGVMTLSTDLADAGGELGLYTPQVGVGVTHGWLIYDAGEDKPWIWQ